eukprot:CAMPEP_0194495788 /NCGR_PEP_ID=MMETSP0253-20130528/13272_1 /TAXON_ID=2966 /ORGANISM="Noctiluca scintillans" /LENGTH=173 /DNA_ID=CAMNT_0039337101 /DNA_START=370 /DNA_END=891 /DNA_ORIENTATION=+
MSLRFGKPHAENGKETRGLTKHAWSRPQKSSMRQSTRVHVAPAISAGAMLMPGGAWLGGLSVHDTCTGIAVVLGGVGVSVRLGRTEVAPIRCGCCDPTWCALPVEAACVSNCPGGDSEVWPTIVHSASGASATSPSSKSISGNSSSAPVRGTRSGEHIFVFKGTSLWGTGSAR